MAARNQEKKMNLLMEALAKTFGQMNEVKGKRVQVSRDEIIDILNKVDDDPHSNGCYASVVYVKPMSIYKGKSKWRPDDVAKALDAHSDRSGEDWYRNLTDYNRPEVKGGRKEPNPISSVIAVIRYVLHWASPTHFDKKYNEYATALHDLRMRNGVAIPTDGTLGDNHNQRERSDVGVRFNQTGRLARDYNMAGAKMKSTMYLVDANGDIVTELPGDVVRSMRALPTVPKPEKAVANALSGPALDAYMKAKAELDATFQSRNLPFDQTLAICAGVNGTSYYYINDALKAPIVEKGEVLANADTMRKLAEEQLDETFEAIDGFAK